MDVTDNHPHPPCSIRPAKPEDYAKIAEVWRRCGLEVQYEGRESESAFHRQLEQFPTLYLVACDGPRIVGAVLGSHDHRKGWINRLAVDPEYQRRGLALALVDACEQAIQSEGIEIIAALVDPQNEVSKALFEKLGYLTDVPVCYYRKMTRPEA